MKHLKVVPAPLVAALMAEMRAALCAMEVGDYDRAFAILEARCRPNSPLLNSPPTATLDGRRIAAEIMQLAPPGLITEISSAALEHAAYAIGTVILKQIKDADPEYLVEAIAFAAEFGVSLAPNCGNDD
jgi:hypothetical protein